MPIGVLLIGLASISWGTTGATMTLVAKAAGIGPLLVGWARLAVAAPCLLLTAVFTDFVAARRRPINDVGGVRGGRAAAWRELPSYFLLGVTMAAYQVCYFSAVTLTGVAVAALLAICSAPLLIAILAALFLGEQPPPMVRLSLGMAVAGTALLTVGPRGIGQTSGHFGLGSLLALGAGASYAAYAVTAKGVLSRVRPITVSAVTFTLAAFFLAPALLSQRPPPGALATAWPLLLYLGTGPTAAAYVLYTTGLSRVPATVAGIVSLLEPLTATALGVIAFGEPLGTLGFAGATLLLTSLGLLVVTTPKTVRSADSRPG